MSFKINTNTGSRDVSAPPSPICAQTDWSPLWSPQIITFSQSMKPDGHSDPVIQDKLN